MGTRPQLSVLYVLQLEFVTGVSEQVPIGGDSEDFRLD